MIARTAEFHKIPGLSTSLLHYFSSPNLKFSAEQIAAT
jgi:hypothetical protein